jgi:hypothetical protein
MMGFVRELFGTAPRPVAVVLVVLLAVLAVAVAVAVVVVAVDVLMDPGGHWHLDWTAGERPGR